MTEAILQSTITCPKCASTSAETMPTNACQFFWEALYVRRSLTQRKGIDVCSVHMEIISVIQFRIIKLAAKSVSVLGKHPFGFSEYRCL